jgi:DNA-binding transcriptional regulator LsrR (DeoR family)
VQMLHQMRMAAQNKTPATRQSRLRMFIKHAWKRYPQGSAQRPTAEKIGAYLNTVVRLVIRGEIE